jgi:mRNA-degrading endonuclease RelE of RelBE toxin-antitoxin system
MNLIDKFLKILSKKEKVLVKEALAFILAGRDLELRPEKMKGEKNHYRIRIGRVRIVYIKGREENVIRLVDFRDRVYKKLK